VPARAIRFYRRRKNGRIPSSFLPFFCLRIPAAAPGVSSRVGPTGPARAIRFYRRRKNGRIPSSVLPFFCLRILRRTRLSPHVRPPGPVQSIRSYRRRTNGRIQARDLPKEFFRSSLLLSEDPPPHQAVASRLPNRAQPPATCDAWRRTALDDPGGGVRPSRALH
jgi:hypothetical protein